ncbi:hypothetical protein EJF18_11095 [Clavispora lusitaniae]|uniref:Uncharacterized protein n=3 Tax=Clavispora lusitaniae TaxID=36911 RepID=C4XYP4_CLAL4|nr:uncharacterized protein CLUG_01067 [Clavispora lusitaniae ATCC 42720]KAF5212624.1 hypothetical protein E0198_000120 [Clavispora lusitaniae]EEQ36944.1 hypothetical protein CLUG_01067 [Clavispora lusitaniae ATCC 42720]KAF7584932.1 hypothetical protein FOB63_001004 [Clavispora lusitaniae]QFZ25971.1 hypothetical protein EJF14_11095 [Clavispora lusitaniae]QFZ30726.1 hypothetical protein EJF16_11095 [Clavispora lusitaniae]
MFGAVCSGRPIQLAQQVEPMKWVFTMNNASNINHIAIFLLPQSEFTDPNYTALVYFQLPNSTEFKLLGGLNPNKPSAIFKLNNTATKASQSYFADDDAMNDDLGASVDNVVLNIGIAIEPTPQAEVLLLQEKQKASKSILPAVQPPPAPQAPSDIASLANKIVKHAYNFLGSFVDGTGKVPMKAFDNWWDKFKVKLANNPNFLNELD